MDDEPEGATQEGTTQNQDDSIRLSPPIRVLLLELAQRSGKSLSAEVEDAIYERALGHLGQEQTEAIIVAVTPEPPAP